MRIPVLLFAAAFCLALPAGAQEAGEPAYRFAQPREPLPAKPWHVHFIDENVRTPEGQPNAGAAWTDHFLQAALNNTLQKSAAQSPWERAPGFLSWTIWGYLSPDSKFHGNERLLEMSGVWLDTLFKALETKPADPKAAEKWQPNTLDTWSFQEFTLPLLEIEARPDLKAKVGAERVDRLRAIVVENVRRNTTPAAYNDLMGKAETYINIITHPMAIYVHGWLLTGERKYLQMAHRIVTVLGRDHLPNGMFPYRYRIHGDRHCEYEMMYYHAMNLRGLYLYWWATGSREAEAVFRKAVPYYPLNLEPPFFFNDGADIWWKDQWRTFWPHHVAMVAAVTGDGENAGLANAMARANVSHDRFDLFLGWHAYQQMALKGIQEKPLRTGYVIEDPDIRGVRLRFGKWSSTFTTGSFTYTRASMMKVSEDGKGYCAVHLARPTVRVSALEQPGEPDYRTLGREGGTYSLARGERAAAVATRYAPALTAATWDEKEPLAPWQMDELWLMTDRGAVGLITSLATADSQARELGHQFRFILPPKGEGEPAGERAYRCGEIRFRVWATDLPFAIPERARRYALNNRDRSDWQLSLSDVERSPEQTAQDAPAAGQEKPALLLPPTRDYPKGYRRYSLVEFSPATADGFQGVERIAQGDVSGIRARIGEKGYLALHNGGGAPAVYQAPAGASLVAASWGQAKLPKAQRGKVALRLPAGGAALLAVP